MKRADIVPGEVYARTSFRDSTNYWPVMILSTDSYQQHHRTGIVSNEGGARLVGGTYRKSAVGLLTVSMMVGLTGEEGFDDEAFEAAKARVRELASVEQAQAALQEQAQGGFSYADATLVTDGIDAQTGQPVILGRYELLTSLVMIPGLYVPLVLAERAAEAERKLHADEAEQTRLRAVRTAEEIAGRLDALGITGYHVGEWEKPSRVPLTFEDIESLITRAEMYEQGLAPLKDI